MKYFFNKIEAAVGITDLSLLRSPQPFCIPRTGMWLSWPFEERAWLGADSAWNRREWERERESDIWYRIPAWAENPALFHALQSDDICKSIAFGNHFWICLHLERDSICSLPWKYIHVTQQDLRCIVHKIWWRVKHPSIYISAKWTNWLTSNSCIDGHVVPVFPGK